MSNAKRKSNCLRCGRSVANNRRGQEFCGGCVLLWERTGYSVQPTTVIANEGLQQPLSDLGARLDGWLRVKWELAGGIACKWRFSSGRWAGHYVYFVGDEVKGERGALEGIRDMGILVDKGLLKPSLDDVGFRKK